MVLNLEGGYEIIWGFPDDSVVESTCSAEDTGGMGSDHVGKILRGSKMATHSSILA